MRFTWDLRKARANLTKHGVSFEEASTAVADPFAITLADPDHSVHELRWITFGVSHRRRLLVVAHAEEGDLIRIISSRVATRSERRIYEEEG